MKPLGRTGRRWLLGFHVLFAGAWLGGVGGLLLVGAAGWRPHHGAALALGRVALQYLDYGIVIPSCLGSLATGLLCSWRTPWGFFQHRWVTLKWALTVSMILFGTFFLGPWVDQSAALAERLGLAALQDARYASLARKVALFGAIQLGLLVFMMFLSTLKPWGRRDARSSQGGE